MAATEIAKEGMTSRSGSLSEEVAHVADTIAACERLCLLSARTLLQCADPIGKNAVSFISGVTRDVHSTTREAHPTTTAQCVAALQSLGPVVARFKLGTREGKDLPFHPIDRHSMKSFEPDQLMDDIRAVIDDGLATLEGDQADTPAKTLQKIFDSTLFGYLHPFTASQVLRAIAPSAAVYKPVWWGSLFVVLWFLNRRGGFPHAYPNVQATDSPGTAFLTSKCVEAIESVLQIFWRRRNRFKELIELMEQLQGVAKVHESLSGKTSAPGSASLWKPGHAYKVRTLAADITQRISDLALDSTFPSLYQAWYKKLPARDAPPADDFCSKVVESFHDSGAANAKNHDPISSAATAAIAELTRLHEHVVRIHDVIEYRLRIDEQEPPFAPDGQKPPSERERIPGHEFHEYRDALPYWICSEDYWKFTEAAVAKDNRAGIHDAERPVLEMLEMHWHRHRDACASALKTIEVFNLYLRQILGAFKKVAQPDVPAFINQFSEATKHIAVLRQHLSKDKETGARWADVLMNRHLVSASSGAVTQFDPSELAHALRVACQGDRKIDLELILTALHLLCDAQRPDGSWASQQPFFWTRTGMAASTLSIDTASAIVLTVNALLQNPDRHGTNVEECAARLHRVYDALDRFFRWLSASIQSFPNPRHKKTNQEAPGRGRSQSDPETEPPLYGWCSDRVHEQGRIHSWVTAAALEFLVAFRRLQQERINGALRAEFLSYHPDDLQTFADVAPTDLDKMMQVAGGRTSPINELAPITLQLTELVRPHKQLELHEGPWFAAKPPKLGLTFWSGMFYGPPGTSKTFLAQAIAGELRWPLISLSPADFLSKGGENIESRAQEIFSALGGGSRLVYFFDEFDELIRGRTQAGVEQRSALSFVTPSFLTKFQDLHKAAKDNEFVFILSTNYYERIDSAAKRAGRIDREFMIVYPDKASRAEMVLDYLLEKHGPKKEEPLGATYDDRIRKVAAGVVEINSMLQRLDHSWKRLLDKKWNAKTKTGIYKKSKDKPFIEIFATYTGFLSYQRIKELIKAHFPDFAKVDKADDAKFDAAVTLLLEELDQIDRVESTRYRAEVNLSDYDERERQGVEKEYQALESLFPDGPFPWSPWTASKVRKCQRELHRKENRSKRSKVSSSRPAKRARSPT